MKNVFVICLLHFFSLCFSQQHNEEKEITISIPHIKTIKSSAVTEISIPIKNSIITKKTNNITTAHWDTVNYNPYKNSITSFPFKIEFSDSTYAAPIKHQILLTSHYGWRRGRPHKGVDLDLVTGDSVVSILDGIVRLARYSRTFGNYIVIRHYNGLESTYAHLSKLAVKVNDSVSKGQYIGKGCLLYTSDAADD